MELNKITFQGNKYLDILNIVNNNLQSFINKYYYIINNSNTYTLQISQTKIGLISTEIFDYKDLLPILHFLKVKDEVIIDNLMPELFGIYRHFDVFHQNNDYQRMVIYDYIKQNEKEDILAIGGECYLFTKIVKIKQIYSDKENIIETCKLNHPNVSAELINYHTFQLKEKYNLIIINVGKNGLTSNLLTEIKKYKLELIYISCNEKAIKRDLNLLNGEIYTKLEISPMVNLYHIINLK